MPLYELTVRLGQRQNTNPSLPSNPYTCFHSRPKFHASRHEATVAVVHKRTFRELTMKRDINLAGYESCQTLIAQF